jgi:hypothetical protein
MPYLKAQALLVIVDRDASGLWWRPGPKAIGRTDIRVGSTVDSPSDPAIQATAYKLNKQAKERLRSTRTRRRVSSALETSLRSPGFIGRPPPPGTPCIVSKPTRESVNSAWRADRDIDF